MGKLSNSRMQIKLICIFEIVETILYDYQLQISNMGIIVTNLIGEDEIINADSFWVSHAITNVIKNSIEHLHKNGHIILKTNENEYFKELIIENDGSEIVDSDKVFERFYSKSENGCGIGLSLASKVMILHHGDLKINNLDHKGSQFIFRFPVLRVKNKVF